MWKSDTNANVLPSKSPWSSQLKLILNFPPQCLAGAGGARAASRFPNSQVVTLPATAAGHRPSSERAAELAWESRGCPGTVHLHAPRTRTGLRGLGLGFASLGSSPSSESLRSAPQVRVTDLQPSRLAFGQGQPECRSHRLLGGALPTRRDCGFQGARLKLAVRRAQGLGHAVCSAHAGDSRCLGLRNQSPHTHWAHPASAPPVSSVFSDLLTVHVTCWLLLRMVHEFPRAAVTSWVTRALITATSVVAL